MSKSLTRQVTGGGGHLIQARKPPPVIFFLPAQSFHVEQQDRFSACRRNLPVLTQDSDRAVFIDAGSQEFHFAGAANIGLGNVPPVPLTGVMMIGP